MKKAAQSISVIGGADGPTSIFLVGKGHKEKNIINKIKNSYRNWKYRRKRKKAITRIKAGAHSLNETVQYIVEKYEAVEKDSAYSSYEERKCQMRYSLIQREQPELIGADKTIASPKNIDFQNQEILKQWLREVDDWNNQCMEKMQQLPDGTFLINYHLYVIDCGSDGEIEIETEDSHGIMGMSSSGNIDKLRKIIEDIYLYYGVTQEDINNSTDRYKFLIAELSQ